MRSQAKASSAGSNLGQGASPRSLRRPGALGTLLFALLAAACLIPGFAFAGETRLPIESFGPDGTSGTSFEYPSALAFDQGNERLYALDQAPAQIYGFDASTPGTHSELGGDFPLTAEGSAEEWVDDLVVDSASHNIYFLSEAGLALHAFDSTGAPLGGNFPLGGFGDSCGAAVDPSGNVWVADAPAREVKGYDSSGSPIDSIEVEGHGAPCHIAFDSQDNLYVSFYEGGTWRYGAAGGYASATEIDPESGGYPFGSNAIAVDRSSDDLYVTHANNHVSVYDGSGAFLYEFGATVSGGRFVGIAIDEASNRVYISDYGNDKVQVFGQTILLPEATTEDADGVTTTVATLHGTVDPEDRQLTDCHFEYVTEAAFQSSGFSDLSSGGSAPCVPDAASIPADSETHPVSAEISGLTPGTTYRFRLQAGTAEGSADGPQRTLTTAIGPPVISAQSVESVGTSDAILSAKINPKGARTTYHVEYGTTTSYGQSTPESAPIGFSTDDSEHTVSVHIGGLAPGTAYHFRFLATSLAGSDEGTDTSFATYPTSTSFEPCPNDPFRGGFGSRLPDCRAYEQATPVDKHGADIQGSINLIQASNVGNRVTFYSNGGLPTTGSSSAQFAFMASRVDDGWSTDGLLPAIEAGQESRELGWSEDLSTAVVIAPGPGNVGQGIYLRDTDTATHELALGAQVSLAGTSLAGFAADSSHLILETSGNSLLPEAQPFTPSLYDLDHGALTLVGRIPPGSATSCDDANGPACEPAPEGSFAGPYNWEQSNTANGGASRSYYTQNTISRDGSRVFFTAAGSGQLYVREDGTRTTRISASQRTTPDPNGEKPAAFMAATPDGSKVFFTSCEKLTDDSTAVSTGENKCVPGASEKPQQGSDLYSYDVDSGELTDLTVDSNAGDPKGADVQGVLGASEDGSYVYFVANGVLADDPGVSPGGCVIGDGENSNSCNLYVSHEGTTAFIASLKQSDDGDDWKSRNVNAVEEPKTSRVAADGRTLLFSSTQSLTGYDNVKHSGASCNGRGSVAGNGESCRQLFRYSTPDKGLSCVSCNPTGVPPIGEAVLGTSRSFFHGRVSPFLTRNLSAGGDRAFFDSLDPLLPTDTNGVADVYEWEAEGSGSCETPGGCVYLLSSGTSPDPSYFGDASADGDHVFIFTSQQLVPTDRDELVDVYDAGVGAGLSAQHTLAPPTCTGVACQANPAPPSDPPTASATFSGPGNAKKPPVARKCPKGKRKVRRAGKVRCQKASKAKQHKRHTNRGGSK